MAKIEKMTDEDFAKEGGNSNYFKRGVHPIMIIDAVVGKSEKKGTPYILFEVEGDEGQRDTVERMYVTEGTSMFLRRNLSAFLVHNKETEKEKEAVREFFKTIDDTDMLLDKKFLDKFLGLRGWILRDEDENSPKPNGGYYLRNQLYAYAPKFEEKDTAESIMEEGEKVDLSVIPF